jgi:hypothetical protein
MRHNKGMKNEIALTPKETALLSSILKGMDEPGCGWLHELADETRATAGILGSLVKKGLVVSSEIKEKGEPTCYWVELATA